MKAKERFSRVRILTLSTLALASLSTAFGQTQINLATQGRNVDFTNAPYTKPIRSGTSLPAQCSANEFFLNTTATPGQNLFACIGATWTVMAAQSGLSDPGANGLLKRTGTNTTTVVPAPGGAVVGTTDIQTLTGKSIDASEITSGVLPSARFPGLIGDVTSPSGSTSTALTSVLQTPGTFGDATHSVQVTVDSKGRVTSLTSLPIVTAVPQVLTGTSIDASEINSGVLTAARMPGLSGDVTAASGSTSTALASVLQTPGTFGDATHSVQVTVDSKGRVTSLTSLPIVTGPTSVFYQQLSRGGAATVQRPALNLSGAFAMADNSSSSRTDIDLAPVNSTPGTFGAANQTPVITVNAYGQITAITTAAVASTNNVTASTVTSMTSGVLNSMPSSCSTGNLYFVTDQPAGQQIYVCSSNNSWGQFMSLGGSGALAFNNGSLDLVTGVVPRLAAANSFTGANTFSSGITLAGAGTQPACNSSARGLLWFQNNGAARDGLQVCAYSGSAYAWVSLY